MDAPLWHSAPGPRCMHQACQCCSQRASHASHASRMPLMTQGSPPTSNSGTFAAKMHPSASMTVCVPALCAGEVHLETCVKDLRERFARIQLQVGGAEPAYDILPRYRPSAGLSPAKLCVITDSRCKMFAISAAELTNGACQLPSHCGHLGFNRVPVKRQRISHNI